MRVSCKTYLSSLNKAIEFGEIKQTKGYYAVQGHLRSQMSVPIERSYANLYYQLIVTDILSGTV